MLAAPIPSNEHQRLSSLRQMLLLSTPDEEVFDRITRTASLLFSTPIALVSLIDAERQWFKSCIGLPVRETPRDVSFCGHAIQSDDLFVIEDARADERFADNPLVTGEPHVIFYAGCPLTNAEGHRIGTLCVIDHHPRAFGQKERQALRDLGHWVEQVFRLRELGEVQQQMLQALDEAQRGNLLDPVLNVWKADAVFELLKNEVNRAYRHHRSLTVMMFRIDQMQTLLARHGAAFEHCALTEVARNLRSMIKAFDTIGRYGEDSLLLILPEAHADLPGQLARQLNEAFSLLPCLVGEEFVDITLSVATCQADFVSYTPNAHEMINALLADLTKS